MNVLFHELTRVIGVYKSRPNIEIEVRFGWKHKTHFDTNLQIHFYELLKRKFTNSDSFKERRSSTEVYIYDSCRVIADTKGEILDIHQKVKLEFIDLALEGTPYDVRISVCQERPVKNMIPKLDQKHKIRSRERNQYSYKMWNYDLTRVFVHSTESYVYEFELELNVHNTNNKHTPEYLAHSMLMKINDVVNFSVDNCENIHLKNVRYL
jgi:uncharacterized ubiquitin-like protein YukD